MVREDREDDVGKNHDEAATDRVRRVEARRFGQRQPLVALVARDRRGGLPAIHSIALVAVVIGDPRHLGKLLVDPRQVVILLKILGDQLPVRVDVERLLVHRRPTIEAVPSHAIGKVAEPVE